MGHTFSQMLVHVVFSTKGRRNFIDPHCQPRLYQYMAGIARGEFGSAIAIAGTENHLHALLIVGCDKSIADIMCKWKSLSSRWVHQTFGEMQDFAWQAGYAAFSVSQSNLEAVKRYISQQQEHHRGDDI